MSGRAVYYILFLMITCTLFSSCSGKLRVNASMNEMLEARTVGIGSYSPPLPPECNGDHMGAFRYDSDGHWMQCIVCGADYTEHEPHSVIETEIEVIVLRGKYRFGIREVCRDCSYYAGARFEEYDKK